MPKHGGLALALARNLINPGSAFFDLLLEETMERQLDSRLEAGSGYG
jgi:hypothetical protein